MMKALYRYIVLAISSLLLAIFGFNTLPTDNLLSDILSENPHLKIAIIAIIFIGYILMYALTTAIMSFISSIFYKIATENKEEYDIKSSQQNSKTIIVLLIALHVLCFGLQLLTNYIMYAVVYLAVGLLIVYVFTKNYKRKHNPSLKFFVASIPYLVYVVGNVIYSYFNFRGI